ncbi:MAG TPA: hypothetical protein VF188_03605 [Longimicrobiales bacterium]
MARDGFDMKDYVDVAARIHAFYERYPEGSIQTEMVRLEGEMVVFKATVYRDREDTCPTTGWAYEREGVGYVNKTSFIENCETSAIGRALANLNFPTTRSAEERRAAEGPASREALDEVIALAESEAVGEEIRERVLARVEQGMTVQQAADAVAYLRRLHRRAERAA